MPYNVRIVSTFPPLRCGIGTFTRDMANALEHFTGEVGHIRVATIDDEDLSYHIPVDLVIDKFNPDSWRDATHNITQRARETNNPTVIILQHEYGLDPADDGTPAGGRNYVKMAREFSEEGLLTFAYLHTVVLEPTTHQRSVVQGLAEHCDGLFVTTESAIDILDSDIYEVPRSKVKHVDHGIRMQNPSLHDRLHIKERYGIQDQFLATTLGMQSPRKGVEYGIRAFGRFLNESCTDTQREHMLYFIGGECHPNFRRAHDGRLYREYQQSIRDALREADVRWIRTNDLDEVDLADYEVVMYDRFLEEEALLDFYAATNAMILPYLDMQQISSGVLADTVGAGRVAIATKFLYAIELISPQYVEKEGLVMERNARGILVDPEEPSVEQIAQALDLLVFNEDERLGMERRAHERGHQMRWQNSAWQLLQYIEFVRQKREISTGRGVRFERQGPSIYADRNEELVAPPPRVPEEVPPRED